MGYTPWRSQLAKKRTSCQVFWDSSSLQIDIGNKWQGKPTNYLLITHLHYDHVEEFKTCPEKTIVLVPSGTFIEPLKKKNPKVSIRLIKGKNELKNGLIVKPFPVLHSSTTLTYGFHFAKDSKKFVWLPDYCIIPDWNVFQNLDALFIGASALKKPIQHRGYGHCQAAIFPILKKLVKIKNRPKKIYLIHFGMGMSPIILKTRYLQKNFPNLKLNWTKDGKIVRI